MAITQSIKITTSIQALGSIRKCHNQKVVAEQKIVIAIARPKSQRALGKTPSLRSVKFNNVALIPIKPIAQITKMMLTIKVVVLSLSPEKYIMFI